MRAELQKDDAAHEWVTVWRNLEGVLEGRLPEGRPPATADTTLRLPLSERFDPLSRMPQVLRCGWTGKLLLFRYQGACATCGRTTFDEASRRNDPRGILGDSAAMIFDAQDDPGLHPGARIVTCFSCGNEEPLYKEAMRQLRALSGILRRREEGLA